MVCIWFDLEFWGKEDIFMRKGLVSAFVVLALFLSACGTADSQKSVTITGSYWVENGVRLVSGDTVVFEDSDGIYQPILSRDGRYLAYSNSGDKLFLYNLTNGKTKTVYTLDGDSADYRVYAVGWSADSQTIALETSHSGGFIGGNELITVPIGGGKPSVVTKSLNSADWGSDGNFVVADSSEVNIIDGSGRKVKKLTTPEMNAFYTATNPTFSPDGKSVVYSCGETFYLHDIEQDTYTKIFTVKTQNGAARMNDDGSILVADGDVLYTYNTADQTYQVYYDKASSSYPNWRLE